MPEHVTLRLFNAQQGYEAIKQAWQAAKNALMAGHRLVVEVRPETRSLKQNALLHALIGDIARQLEWAGAKRDAEVWKRLLVAAWLRAQGESVEVLPALDGHGVDVVFRRTSQLNKAECAELVDFIYAWAAERGVHFRESGQWIDWETGEIVENAAQRTGKH
ncbi:MAG: recombination protein NinB [Comamonadaceae bacterium]|nr:recombination protein NinB [Comamonadaceae bacterium]